LWIALPTVGELLESVVLDGTGGVPDLDVDLTQRERQVLGVLHRSPYPVRYGQLAALVWSDPDRTHDVRSTLYRLRAKLRGSAWAIPIPPRGQGVRLLHLQPDALEPDQGGPESRSARRRLVVRVLAELTAAGATVSRAYWKRLAGRQSKPSERRQPLVEPRSSRP
jgi:hypothetical protein